MKASRLLLTAHFHKWNTACYKMYKYFVGFCCILTTSIYTPVQYCQVLEKFIHTDTVNTEKDKMASVEKIGHTDASQESEREPVVPPKSHMCIIQPCLKWKYIYTKPSLIHSNTSKHHPTQSSRGPASAAAYHLRALAADGRAEDTALLEGRCSQALNELLVLDTLTSHTLTQQEQMRSSTTSLKCSFDLGQHSGLTLHMWILLMC